MSDNKKISFIMCTNNRQTCEEALYYISLLRIPTGYTTDTVLITDAKSMCEGYNRAMKISDAKYKVYMHQDVMIICEDFIEKVLNIFNDKKTGMIGMVGSPRMPANAIMWDSRRIGGLYSHTYFGMAVQAPSDADNPIEYVEAVDGFLMVTQYDIPWREDLFTHFDFYDISQSFEFRKAGYRIAVPMVDPPWCFHNSGYNNLTNYYEERLIFVREYDNMLHHMN